jgi:hypothetical protein
VEAATHLLLLRRGLMVSHYGMSSGVHQLRTRELRRPLQRPDITLDARGLGWLTTVAIHEAWRLGSTVHERPAGALTSPADHKREPGERPEPADTDQRGTDEKALDHIEHATASRPCRHSSPASAKRSTSRDSATATPRSCASLGAATPPSTVASAKAAPRCAATWPTTMAPNDPPQQQRDRLVRAGSGGGRDNTEIIDTVHARRAPMVPVDSSLRR